MENQFTYHEWKQMLVSSRGNLVEMLDLAQGAGDLTEKERDVLYYRLIEWNSLERTGQKFGVTRERIRQIEAKAEEKLRYLTKKRHGDCRDEKHYETVELKDLASLPSSK
jgi:DNA-directed RNA polymerase sigma subunit (sigma70/sigma32)